MPYKIQDELVNYPEVIEVDSSYEDDDVILKKYKNDPLKYIIGTDDAKCRKIKEGETIRIHRARKAKGVENIKDIV